MKEFPHARELERSVTLPSRIEITGSYEFQTSSLCNNLDVWRSSMYWIENEIQSSLTSQFLKRSSLKNNYFGQFLEKVFQSTIFWMEPKMLGLNEISGLYRGTLHLFTVKHRLGTVFWTEKRSALQYKENPERKKGYFNYYERHK